MKGLGADAKQQLRDAGIPFTYWTRYWFDSTATRWYGDTCGCLDDRCRGHHHDEDQWCGCLPAMIEQYQDAVQAAFNAGRE